MDELDFSSAGKRPAAQAPAAPAPDPVALYDPRLALEFFKIAGTPEQFPAGRQIFVENEDNSGFFSKGARVYLLLEGEVTLTVKNVPLELVLPGETFGEMATIADIPRSATAAARKNCRVLALDEKQFLQSLHQMPEFALMLMSVMSQRVRRRLDLLARAGKGRVAPLVHQNTLDRRMLSDLRRALGEPSPSFAHAGENVVTQGAVAACLFVVTEGRITVSVDDVVIEEVGPGGVVGEMALVAGSSRFATATAETDSAWLLIGREEFLATVKSMPAFGIALLRSMSERVQHLDKLLAGAAG